MHRRSVRSLVQLGTSVGLVLVLVALAACSVAPAPQQKPLTKIQFLQSLPWTPAYAHFAVADYLGYFKEEGFDVEWVITKGSNESAQLIAAGSAQFGNVATTPIVQGRQPGQNMPIKVVYNELVKNIFGIAVLDDSPVKGPADLKGKSVGVSSMGSSGLPMGKAAVAEVGLNAEKDVNWVAVGVGPQALTALKGGQIAALSMWDEMFAQIENLGVKLRVLDTPGINKLITGGQVAHENLIKEHPDWMVGLNRAVARGTVFTLANPDAAIQIFWKVAPDAKPKGKADDVVLAEQKRVLQARWGKWRIEGKPWGYMDAKMFQDLADFLVATGVIKENKTPANEFFTDQFIADINKFDENKIKEQARNYKVQ